MYAGKCGQQNVEERKKKNSETERKKETVRNKRLLSQRDLNKPLKRDF